MSGHRSRLAPGVDRPKPNTLLRGRIAPAPHRWESALERTPSTLGAAVPSGQGQAVDLGAQPLRAGTPPWDLARIRIHAGAEASQLAALFGASAYAVGNQIVLGDERQRRGSLTVPELLRHEIRHTRQQLSERDDWRRVPLSLLAPGHLAERDAAAFAQGRADGSPLTRIQPCLARVTNPQLVYDYQALVARRRQIWNLALNPPPSPDPNHHENPGDNRYHAILCFNRIRLLASRQQLPNGRTEEDYYQILEDLLNTPKAAPVAASASPDLRRERNLLEADWIFAAATSPREEALTTSLPNHRLPDGTRVQVQTVRRRTTDANVSGRFTIYLYRTPGETTWYRHAHIVGSIYLQPARTGTGGTEDAAIIRQITETVQDIENTARGTPGSGVTFDLDILTAPRRGVTTFRIDTSQWMDSTNPWGAARTMVEELFHNIGMEDVYDYTQHATNDVYSIHERLDLLYRQLGKYAGDPTWRPDLPSITRGAASPSDFDYCQVLAPGRVAFNRCMSERGVPAAP